MRQALVSGRFRLAYQPQVDLATGAVVGGAVAGLLGVFVAVPIAAAAVAATAALNEGGFFDDRRDGSGDRGDRGNPPPEPLSPEASPPGATARG